MRNLIRSEKDCAEYYRGFLLILRLLISKNRICSLIEARRYLTSFEPSPAVANRTSSRKDPDDI